MSVKWLARLALAPLMGLALMSTDTPAEACGCLSPPVPTVGEADYAVNQQAEQIIFEVEPGYVTAHVLIRYQGDPAKFAWIVPVPSVPELALSESLTFALLDDATAPQIGIQQESLCPSPEYTCEQHPMPTCGNESTSAGPGPSTGAGNFGAGGGGGGGQGEDPPPGIDVIEQQQIGSYDTVTFGAGDASAAVNWLQSEGFIVNDTMTPYMQPYIDANMLFVAAKLVPGADASEIRPLRMRYQADNPMIPLQLTAVAAEPHLTVTSYIFGDQRFQPSGHPEITIDPLDISSANGRVNYPMVLARAIDEAGRDAFVAEYAGTPPAPGFRDEPCCSEDFDFCGVGFDGLCQCPGSDFDAEDCAEQEDLLNAIALMDELGADHNFVTRLTTRVSGEEMSFDPGFEPFTSGPSLSGRLVLNGTRKSLELCESDVIDGETYREIEARQACAAVYCGAGDCVVAGAGAACDCNAGFVARRFFDVDGERSVTCVPDEHPVDFAAAGITLPDACLGVSCGAGSCVDVGGFPTCRCDPGYAATTGTGAVPTCAKIEDNTGTSGARDYSAALEALAVCAPPPPTCGDFGWLVENQYKSRQGVVCESSVPSDPSAFEIPPEPTCADFGLPELEQEQAPAPSGGCGCRAARSEGSWGWGALVAALGFVWLRRRRSSMS